MTDFFQNTINSKVQLKGVGLHTGNKVKMNLLPAGPNHGIVFKRIDLKSKNLIPAIFNNVDNAVLCTSIRNEFGVSVSTIEHLMGALIGEKIDNILVEVNSNELPIMDGSAKEFVKQLRVAGTKSYDTPKKFIKVLKRCEISRNEKSISLEPHENDLIIDFEIVYKNQLIGTQRKSINVFEDDLDPIYNSRTFCLYEEIDKVNQLGLGKGGSLDNAVVIKGDSVVNEGGLRYADECVMHKILDCMGDLMLTNYKILGKIQCSRGGHQLTNELLREFLSNTSNYSVIEFREKIIPSGRFYIKTVAASA